jgi:hypothetical protein
MGRLFKTGWQGTDYGPIPIQPSQLGAWGWDWDSAASAWTRAVFISIVPMEMETSCYLQSAVELVV